MDLLNEVDIACPYCGERISVTIDGSIEQQHYIEDCQVCCQPMVLRTRTDQAGNSTVEALREDDA